jgi:DNA-binding YbaB/EbfC family protein
MFKGIANLASVLRQAQQMGGKVKEISEQLKAKRALGSAGGGMVEVETNGLGEVLRVKIDPDLVERGEREMIEDLLPAAFNQAAAKAKQLHVEMMQSVAQDIDIPGLGDAIAQFTGSTNEDEGGKGDG